MGDTGSLSIGGMIGVVAICCKQEFLLAVVGGVFVIEAISVIMQVLSFQLTGRRIFAMSPLHHHFELVGWKENAVIVRFWILSAIFALLGLATLKLRGARVTRIKISRFSVPVSAARPQLCCCVRMTPMSACWIARQRTSYRNRPSRICAITGCA